MRPVIDESVLAQLNAQPVTDPGLIAQLEGGSEKSIPRHVGDVVVGGPVALGETALQMMTGFAGALPGAAAGLYEAARGREYAPAFKHIQEQYMYEPRTEYGQRLSGMVSDLFHKYSSGVDVIAEKTPGGPLAQTAVKTFGEAIPLVAPFAPRAIRGIREQLKPVTDPATLEALGKPAEVAPVAVEPVKPLESAIAETPRAPRQVTDPATIAELEKPFALEAPTEAGLRAKADQLAASERADQQATTTAEAKTSADTQVKDFALAGSDRPADLNPLQAELPIKEVTERAYRPPRLDTQNDSITTAVAKLGGLRTDFAQDIAATGAVASRDVRGFQYMFHRKGRTADEMAEALHQRGYLESRDINEMFEKLDIEIRAGEPTHFSMEQNIDAFMERRMAEKYGPNMELYSGLPVHKIGDTISYANRKLHDALGVPEKGVTVEKAPEGRKPGILTPLRSPSELAKEYPQLKPFKERADRAQVEMDTLRDAFSRRLAYVDRQLGGGGLLNLKNITPEFRANKKALNEILLAGDFIGKRFTRDELKAQFNAPDNVITAYEGLRSAYDHALTIANQTRALRGKEAVSRREGYVPHFFHDYFILGDGQILGSARTLREAVSMANDAARGGTEVRVAPKQMRFEGEETQAAIVGDATYFKLREGLEEAFSMTRDQAQMLLEDIARMRGRSRVVGNFFERKGAPNWDKNLDWAHKHYFNMISRYAALDKFKAATISNFEMRYGPFDREYKGIAKYTKDYINDILGVPSRAEELIDGAIKSIPGVSKIAENFLGQRPSLELATATTNAVAIAKLGLYNVSAALVNGSQALMSQAVLGPRWFAEGAARAARITAELTKRKLGAEGATTPDIGILRQLDIPIQQGLESGAGYSKTGRAGQLFKASTAFFRGVEFELRASTGLGAYYKALAEGRSKPEALEYARDANRRVNFDYSTGDAPSFIRRAGPAGQVLFQFKKFPIKAMEFMGNLRGAEHARFWIPFALISGYYGFPGIEALNNGVKSLFDIDLQLETKNYLMRWAGDDKEKKAVAKTIFYGAFANDELGGIDISHRVGGGDFIPSRVSDAFGPFFSSTVRATQMAASDHWVEALREVATAPGNVAIALRNEGDITSARDRDRLTTKLDTTGRVLKGLGFSTVRESAERDASRVMRYTETKQRDNEKQAIDQFIQAFKMNDGAAIDKAIGRFAALGMGEGTAERIKEEMQKKGMTVSERIFHNLPKKGQARQMEVMEFAR